MSVPIPIAKDCVIGFPGFSSFFLELTLARLQTHNHPFEEKEYVEDKIESGLQQTSKS